MLKVFDKLPDALLRAESNEVHDILGGPGFVVIPGKNPQPLAITVLQHGNEFSGWYALQKVLNDFSTIQPPRTMAVFIANTEAAAKNERHLAHQLDYNRAWPGSDLQPSIEHSLMRQVVDRFAGLNPLASVDLHNNTGNNPHYACVNNLHPQSLYLAQLFSRTIVYFLRPLGVQSMAMSKICPAVTVECGMVSESNSIDHAYDFLHKCLQMPGLPDVDKEQLDIDLYHTVARAKIHPDIEFSFEEPCQLMLDSELETFNFRDLPGDTVIGQTESLESLPVFAIDENGADVTDLYFGMDNNRVITKQGFVPAMLTTNSVAVRQDCLCYIMEKISGY